MKLSSILFKYAHPYVLLCYLHLLLAFSAVICMFLRGNLLSRKPLHRRGFFFVLVSPIWWALRECTSLRSWRYCVGARLKFWRRSRVPKEGSSSWRLRRQISLDYITTAPPPNLTRLLHTTASYAGYECTTAKAKREMKREQKERILSTLTSGKLN